MAKRYTMTVDWTDKFGEQHHSPHYLVVNASSEQEAKQKAMREMPVYEPMLSTIENVKIDYVS